MAVQPAVRQYSSTGVSWEWVGVAEGGRGAVSGGELSVVNAR